MSFVILKSIPRQWLICPIGEGEYRYLLYPVYVTESVYDLTIWTVIVTLSIFGLVWKWNRT